jgi:hypothetical protein
LITRFVDSDAEFLFVAAAEVGVAASKDGAIPFDAPGVELGHHENRCSFDAILAKFGLKDKALQRMAQIVNAADTDRLNADPIAAGLEAIASGYSLRFPDDLENLGRQFEIYDALYAWCRLETTKRETH